ncbi:MAG TPA: SCO family protein [Kofleriaceae bacterium]|nr:SCO family protein [Kofleriaceae bacterium]
MFNRRQWLGGLSLLPLASAAVGHAEPAPPVKAPPRRRFARPLSGREILRRRSFPNLTLTTSDGARVKFYDHLLKDKIVILNLMYATCEGICPTTISNLKEVKKILRAEVAHPIFIYSMTIKPEQDTPDKLREYAKMHQIDDPEWLFLTGSADDVDTLRHLLGFADPDAKVDRDKARHSGMLRYGNEPRAIWGSCQGSADPAWIAQEVQFAVPRELKRNPRVND